MSVDPPLAACRVCAGPRIERLGRVEYLAGYPWEVHACADCGCRFTRHDDAVHDLLHRQGSIAYYDEYRDLAVEAKRRFDAGDCAGLAALLSPWTKYRFVIDAVDALPAGARILEAGCSRGYLAAYALARGRTLLGVDVSRAAIEGATRDFGAHFAAPDSPLVDARAPYDLIYHVGMIGCLADPIGSNRRLVGLLAPGGRLIFNAPNLAACRMQGQLWLDSSPPPDLVTLFPAGFWEKQLGDIAGVRVRVEALDGDRALDALHDRLRRWRPPVPHRIDERAAPSQRPHGLIGRALRKAARALGLARLAPPQPSEFGLLVEARRKAS